MFIVFRLEWFLFVIHFSVSIKNTQFVPNVLRFIISSSIVLVKIIIREASPHAVMANMLDSNIVVSEFELQLSYYVIG